MMFFITKKRILEAAVEIYMSEATEKAWSENNLYYRMGNANALNALCSRLGVPLHERVKQEYKNYGAKTDEEENK